MVAVALAGAGKSQERRIDRPEGYLELEGDAGTPAGKGSYTVVPSPGGAGQKAGRRPTGEDPSLLEDQYPPPPPSPTPRETCQPVADKFSRRLAVLRGNTTDAGGEALDPVVQRAMFGRTALRTAPTDPDQPVPELTWDEELQELHRAYQSCIKAATQRSR